jgi:signal transduction histidine kinase
VEVDVGALAAEVVGEYAPIAESKHVDLGLVRRDAGLVIDGEPEALRTVLSNLVDNAVRYTQAGGHVDVSASRTAEGIVLEVADDGPGIPAEDRERVFDRFYRRAGTEVPGSGLGLAIVRRIAERHGATVTLDAGPGGRGLAARVVFTAAAEGLRKP